jgi:hypothetical protein
VRIKYIQHIQLDLDKLTEVDDKQNKKYYLNQAYIIQLVANWQVFIEELVKYGVSQLLEEVNKSSGIQNFNNVLTENSEQKIKKFNTPNSRNINEIIQNTIGIKSISDKFQWDKMSKDKAIQKLNEIIDIRHGIAHTGKNIEELFLEKNFNYMEHLYNLAYILQYTVDCEIHDKAPRFKMPHPDNIF